jgi:hypothetical protein
VREISQQVFTGELLVLSFSIVFPLSVFLPVMDFLGDVPGGRRRINLGGASAPSAASRSEALELARRERERRSRERQREQAVQAIQVRKQEKRRGMEYQLECRSAEKTWRGGRCADGSSVFFVFFSVPRWHL